MALRVILKTLYKLRIHLYTTVLLTQDITLHSVWVLGKTLQSEGNHSYFIRLPWAKEHRVHPLITLRNQDVTIIYSIYSAEKKHTNSSSLQWKIKQKLLSWYSLTNAQTENTQLNLTRAYSNRDTHNVYRYLSRQ